jgi:WD40 repeat protein
MTDLSLTGAERDFLEASVLAETTAAEATSRRRRRILIGFGAAAVLALILAATAAAQQRSADQQRQVATARELSLQAAEQLDIDPERSVLLALEAIDLFDSSGGDASQAVTSLRNAVAADRTVARFPGAAFVAVSPDGSMLATGDGHSGVTIRERAGGAVLATLTRPGAEALGADFSPDGTSVAVAYLGAEEGPISVWLADGSERRDLAGPPLPADALPPWLVGFSPDGALIALTYPAEVRVWNTSTLDVSYVVEGAHIGLFDPSSGDLIAGDLESRTIRILDAADGSAISEFPVAIEPQDLSVSPDGRWLAVTSQTEASVALYSLDSGAEVWVRAIDRPFGLTWVGDGSRLVVGGDAGEPQVLDTQNGTVVAELLGHNGTVWAVARIPGTELVATVGANDGTTLVWNVERGPMPEIGRYATGLGHPRWFAFSHSADRLFLSVVGPPAQAWIADTDTLEPVFRITRPMVGPGLEPLVVGDGRYLITITEDRPSTLVDIATGDIVYVAPQGRVVRDASVDGHSVVTVPDPRLESPAPSAAIVNFDTGEEVLVAASLSTYHPLSADASLVTANEENGSGIVLYDTATGVEAVRLPGASSVYVMPDGANVSVVTVDGRHLLAPLESLRNGIPLDEAALWGVKASDGYVVMHTASPDGAFILTGARREPFRIWDATTGRLVAELDSGSVSAEPRIQFSPNDPRHVTALADDGILLTYTLDTGELTDIARSRLTRGLTDEECVAFLHLVSGCPAD